LSNLDVVAHHRLQDGSVLLFRFGAIVIALGSSPISKTIWTLTSSPSTLPSS
jgi:hypothetical protein